MASPARSDEVREAVEELQSYFSDNLPPLLVADSFALLLEEPPEVVAHAIQAWVGSQYRVLGGTALVSDFVFHAVKKIHLLGELRLVSRERLRDYVERLTERVVEFAPQEERGELRAHLGRVDDPQLLSAPAAGQLLRPSTGGASQPASTSAGSAGALQLSAEAVRGLRRFALLLERVAPPGGGPAAGREISPEVLAAAVESARNGRELEQYLQKAGLGESSASEAIRSLSRGMPGWMLHRGEDVEAYESASATAMRRIVSMAEDPAKGAERFREMLKAAVEQVNGGGLGRAVAIVEAAQRVVEEGRVEKATSDLIRGSLGDAFDTQRLLALARERDHQPALRKVLSFFPAFTPQGVFERLTNEPDRQRRKLWLALAEMYGPASRALAVQHLENSISEPLLDRNAWWHQRNFVYLMYRLAPPGPPAEREVELVAQLCDLQQAGPLVREGFVYLSLAKSDRAVTTLAARLAELERLLCDETAVAVHPPAELHRLLNLAVSSLVRAGTAEARRAVIEHGLRHEARLGDCLGRLAELGGYDLADDPAAVDRLLAALDGLLPRRVLGMVIHRNEGGLLNVIAGLAGTTTEPRVRRALGEVARRFPDQACGRAAATALERRPAPPPAMTLDAAPAGEDSDDALVLDVAVAAPSGGALAGDLDLFGLPELLQSLAQNAATGELVLRDRGGGEAGRLWLRGGRLVDCLVGHRRGEAAFYQLLEEPRAGVFEFYRRAAAEVPASFGPADCMPLLLEAMRRHDELQRSRAIVPDDVVLHATGARPSPPPREADGAFVRDVWTRVRDGGTARECEARAAADSYRVRTLLAYWLEEGVLERSGDGAR